MPFKIPKKIKFETITPKSGKGSISAHSGTVRCGLYVWHSNMRLTTVIGGAVCSSVDIQKGSKVKVGIGISDDDSVLITYSRGKVGDEGCYIARTNGNAKHPRPIQDIRFLVTLNHHLHKYFLDRPVTLTPCEHVIKDNSIIVKLHKVLLK